MEYININGCNIAYLTIGRGTKKVIFLHGNNEDHKIFAKMLNKFSPMEYTAYLIDTRAHGESDFKGEISISQFADDVIEFVNKLNLGKVNLVGYSDGANIAMTIGYKKAEIIEKMVLISGNFDPQAIHIEEKIRIYGTCIFTGLFYFLRKARRIHKLQKLMLKGFGIGVIELKKINTPTLIIGAENDIISREHTQLIADNLKNGIVIFAPKTTHYSLPDNEHTAIETEKFIK